MQDSDAVINNCLFLNNVAEYTAADSKSLAAGGAIVTTVNSSSSNLKVTNSIFKNNKALSTVFGAGGAIFATAPTTDVLVLSSVFELNEASNVGGAATFLDTQSVGWYNNKDLLFGNDAGEDCGEVSVGFPPVCSSVGDNFSV